MENSNVIYAYKKRSQDKIVYVGQTVNLKHRHYKHIQYDPFHMDIKEYEYPLSRGIRKYGEEEYELIILEKNVPQEKLDEREKYWIKYYDTYYHGYNQTIGGKNPVKPIFNEEKIDIVIEMLKDESYSYKDIIEKTGISMTHIYNINSGQRRKREGIEYPIRKSNTKGTKGLKFSQEENKNIQDLILQNSMTFKEIANKFNCSTTTIRDINRGKIKAYLIDGYNYPLRENTHSVSKQLYWKNN